MKLLHKFVISNRYGLQVESLNKWQRLHWAQRAQVKKGWVLTFKLIISSLNQFESANEKRTILIKSYRKKLMDKDNFFGGLKPVLDALIENDVLKDDSPQWLRLKAIQRRIYDPVYRGRQNRLYSDDYIRTEVWVFE